MDPNACLRRIASSRGNERHEAVNDLRRWIMNGGFHPDWNACPEGKRVYRHYLGLGDDVRS